MSTVTATKTITSTSAAVFAGSGQLADRIQLIVINLDDSVAIMVNGLPVEPGERTKIKPLSSSTVIYAYSLGRAVQAMIQEVSI